MSAMASICHDCAKLSCKHTPVSVYAVYMHALPVWCCEARLEGRARKRSSRVISHQATWRALHSRHRYLQQRSSSAVLIIACAWHWRTGTCASCHESIPLTTVVAAHDTRTDMISKKMPIPLWKKCFGTNGAISTTNTST